MAALPREVFFEVMRSSLRITYKEVCDSILSDEPIGGLSPKDRGRDAARRNREFIHVGPGTDDTCWKLAESSVYVPALFDRLENILGKDEYIPAIIDTLSGSGAEALRASLVACNLDASIYSNLVNYILDGEQTDRTTAALLMHLFVATAISGKPEASAREVIDKAYSIDYDNVVTSTPPMRECDVSLPDDQTLALMRCSERLVFPSRTYPLSREAEGTQVGSIPLASSCVTDVERGVSRKHLQIWCDGDGQWWCKGMLSLNGTVMVDTTTGTRTVVEPPRDERPYGYEPQAFPLKPADRLILAENTEFLVVSVAL